MTSCVLGSDVVGFFVLGAGVVGSCVLGAGVVGSCVLGAGVRGAEIEFGRHRSPKPPARHGHTALPELAFTLHTADWFVRFR